jgi:ParB family protein of integrating conjugative element (PFGI_1 class)
MSSKFRVPPGTPITQLLANQQARTASNTTRATNMKSALPQSLRDELSAPVVSKPRSESIPPDERPVADAFQLIAIDEIDPFPNIRIQKNPEYDNIRASILANGFRGVLEVTRRPNAKRWTVNSGGNTRLAILKELFAQGNTQFDLIKCTTVPYKGELELLVAHIHENDSRGDTAFWEKAQSFKRLREEMEHEKGSVVSSRDFESYLKRKGLSGARSSLIYYNFANERLVALDAELVITISTRDLKEIQPLYNRLIALLKRLNKLDINVLHDALDSECKQYGEQVVLLAKSSNEDAFDPELTQTKKLKFDAAALSERWCDAVGRILNSHRTAVLQALEFLDANAADDVLRTVLSRSVDSVIAVPHRGAKPPRVPMPPPPHIGVIASDDIPLNEQILIQAQAFADGCGLSSCFMTHPELPLGYYVEIPAEPLPNNSGNNFPHPQYVAWWLLAYVSLQKARHVLEQLPLASRWREAHLVMDGEASWEFLHDKVGPELSAVDVLSHLTYLDHDFSGVIALISVARQLRNAQPDQFAFDYEPH